MCDLQLFFFFAHAVGASIQVTPNIQVLSGPGPGQLKYPVFFLRKVPLFLFILHIFKLFPIFLPCGRMETFSQGSDLIYILFLHDFTTFFNMHMLFEPAYKSLPKYRCYLVNCRKNFFFSGKCLYFSLSCTFLSFFQFSHLVSLLAKSVPRLTQLFEPAYKSLWPNVQVLPDQLKYPERIVFLRKVPLFLFILHILSLLQFSHFVEGWRPFLREVT